MPNPAPKTPTLIDVISDTAGHVQRLGQAVAELGNAVQAVLQPFAQWSAERREQTAVTEHQHRHPPAV